MKNVEIDNAFKEVVWPLFYKYTNKKNKHQTDTYQSKTIGLVNLSV